MSSGAADCKIPYLRRIHHLQAEFSFDGQRMRTCYPIPEKILQVCNQGTLHVFFVIGCIGLQTEKFQYHGTFDDLGRVFGLPFFTNHLQYRLLIQISDNNMSIHDVAIRAAIVYSLVDSCKSLDVEPREWMEDVLLRIPGNENNRDALRELLPDRWVKQSK